MEVRKLFSCLGMNYVRREKQRNYRRRTLRLPLMSTEPISPCWKTTKRVRPSKCCSASVRYWAHQPQRSSDASRKTDNLMIDACSSSLILGKPNSGGIIPTCSAATFNTVLYAFTPAPVVRHPRGRQPSTFAYSSLFHDVAPVPLATAFEYCIGGAVELCR